MRRPGERSFQLALRGLERAAALGAREVEVVNDSELVARQLTGVYKVKHPSMRPLYEEAIAALKAVFPTGVCDFTKRGVAVRSPDKWLSY